MTLEEFNSWFDRLSSVIINKSNRDDMVKFGRFSTGKFTKEVVSYWRSSGI